MAIRVVNVTVQYLSTVTIFEETVQDTLSLSQQAARQFGVESKAPLANINGKIQQIGQRNTLNVKPVDLLYTYDGNGNVSTIDNGAGVKTFTYNVDGDVETISDTETGKVQTFVYVGGQLDRIEVSDL